MPMENPRSADSIYEPVNALIRKIFENDDLEEIVTILADMPSDKLKLVKEMIKNLLENVLQAHPRRGGSQGIGSSSQQAKKVNR